MWTRGGPGLLFAAAAALVIGMIGGGVTGLAIGWMAKPEVKVEVPRELTADELTAACTTREPTPDDPLSLAQNRVADLERNVAEREGKVAELEKQMSKNASKSAKLASELEAARRELAEQKTALETAILEKEQLLGQLSLATTELAVKTQALDAAKEEIVSGRWQDFLNGAILEICDKGNRKKLGDCRTVVSSSLGTVGRSAKFNHCVRSGQALPVVRAWEEGAKLPPYAETIDEAQKEVRGWIVIFCDPTLPEVNTEAPVVDPG